MLTQNGKNVHALQDASGGLLIVDRVVIPEGTPPGEYVLGWRAFRCCLLYVGRAATMMTARVLFVAAFAARVLGNRRPQRWACGAWKGWDCEESNQIWQSCSDVVIKAA